MTSNAASGDRSNMPMRGMTRRNGAEHRLGDLEQHAHDRIRLVDREPREQDHAHEDRQPEDLEQDVDRNVRQNGNGMFLDLGLSWAEQRGADPDLGRPFADRVDEVLAHAH